MTWRMARAVTDLPQPDSPTMHRVVPRGMLKLTPSTALTTPSCVKKCACKSLTSRRLSRVDIFTLSKHSLARIRVCGVAQAIAQEVQREDRHNNSYAGPEQPGRSRNGADILGFLQQNAPTYNRLTQTDAEKAERGFSQDHTGNRQCDHRDDVTDKRRNHVPENDPQRAAPIKLSSFDKILRFQRIKPTPHHARQPCPAED